MKRYIVSVCLAAAALFAGKLEASAQTWHQLTQSQRNTLILAQGNVDNGKMTSYTCKTWVQLRVIPMISGGAVTIPQNRNNYSWFPAPYVYAHQQPFRIEWSSPGQIVQMQVPNRTTGILGPHTAIIASFTSSEVILLDCNWYGDGKVQYHPVAYNDFYRWVQNYNYTVYTIQ